jgi:hypothetical protein
MADALGMAKATRSSKATWCHAVIYNVVTKATRRSRGLANSKLPQKTTWSRAVTVHHYNIVCYGVNLYILCSPSSSPRRRDFPCSSRTHQDVQRTDAFETMSGTSSHLARTRIVHNDPWGTHKWRWKRHIRLISKPPLTIIVHYSGLLQTNLNVFPSFFLVRIKHGGCCEQLLLAACLRPALHRGGIFSN